MAADKIMAQQVGKGPGSTPVKINLIVRWQVVGLVTPGFSGETPFEVTLSTNEMRIQKDLRDAIAAYISGLTGQTFTAADVRGPGMKCVQHVEATFAPLEFSKDIVFAVEMPSDTGYSILPQPLDNMSTSFWPTNQSATGFTLNTSGSISGTVRCVIVED